MTFGLLSAAEGFANLIVLVFPLLLGVALLRWMLKIDLIVKRFDSIVEELQRLNKK